MKKKFQSGFTLIELLVVIAIIAILAAILFPVFAQAREKARQTVCLSNMKQIGTGLIMYTSDYDGYWPRDNGCSTTPLTRGDAPKPWGCNGPNYLLKTNAYKWQAWIMPYEKNVDVFFCPSRVDKAKGINPDTGINNWLVDGEIYHAYSLNTSITGDLEGSNDSRSFLGNGSQAALQTPAETFIVMEGAIPTVSSLHPADNPFTRTIYPAAYYKPWYGLLYPPAKGARPVDRTIAPHSEGFVFSFCDGHAKWYSAKDFLSRCAQDNEYIASGFPLNIDLTDVFGNNDRNKMTVNEGQKVVVTKDFPLWGLVKNQ